MLFCWLYISTGIPSPSDLNPTRTMSTGATNTAASLSYNATASLNQSKSRLEYIDRALNNLNQEDLYQLSLRINAHLYNRLLGHQQQLQQAGIVN